MCVWLCINLPQSARGEWDEVCIDIPRNLTLNAKASSYQWVYTAVTRARKMLHIVNDFYISN